MEIWLDDDYCICSDRYNIILKQKIVQKTGKKKGEKVLKDVSFHNDVEGACIKFLKVRINLSDANTAAKLITEWNSLLRKIKKACNGRNND